MWEKYFHYRWRQNKTVNKGFEKYLVKFALIERDGKKEVKAEKLTSDAKSKI